MAWCLIGLLYAPGFVVTTAAVIDSPTNAETTPLAHTVLAAWGLAASYVAAYLVAAAHSSGTEQEDVQKP